MTRQDGSTLWVVLFTAAGSLATLTLACAMPFPAFAALAAAHLRRGPGMGMMMLVWAVSQVVGFGLLHYPHDPKTLVLAGVMGLAAIAALFGARAGTGGRFTGTKLIFGYVGGFVAFKLAVVVGMLLLGNGVATILAPALLAKQFLRDGLILIGLHVFYRLLRATGVPGPGRRVGTA